MRSKLDRSLLRRAAIATGVLIVLVVLAAGFIFVRDGILPKLEENRLRARYTSTQRGMSVDQVKAIMQVPLEPRKSGYLLWDDEHLPQNEAERIKFSLYFVVRDLFMPTIFSFEF